ncbi:hypothetical protein ACFL0H_00195 [Thermodesulfobacteriota bacterium]
MNFKNFLKLLVIFFLSWIAGFLILKVSNGCIVPVFEETLAAFIVVVLFATALSFALFNFVDNISKDISNYKEQFNQTKYQETIQRLSVLKKEIILNAGMILIFFLFERVAKGVFTAMNVPNISAFQLWLGILISFRISCFFVSFIAVVIQLRGFITAIEFRSITSKLK